MLYKLWRRILSFALRNKCRICELYWFNEGKCNFCKYIPKKVGDEWLKNIEHSKIRQHDRRLSEEEKEKLNQIMRDFIETTHE